MNIPNSVTSIGGVVFNGCTGLTSVDIPNSVTSIGYRAFTGCTSLTSVDIPSSVTSIGWGAFSGCAGLTSVDIPNSVTSVNDYAFCGCTSLASVAIPNSVTSIGDYAFDGCTGLTSVDIPNSVTSIGTTAFPKGTKVTRLLTEPGDEETPYGDPDNKYQMKGGHFDHWRLPTDKDLDRKFFETPMTTRQIIDLEAKRTGKTAEEIKHSSFYEFNGFGIMRAPWSTGDAPGVTRNPGWMANNAMNYSADWKDMTKCIKAKDALE